MEILERAPQSNDIVFFADGSWDAVGSSGKIGVLCLSV